VKPPPPVTAPDSGRSGTWLEPRFVGRVAPGALVELVVSHGGLSKRAVLEARVRKTQAEPFAVVPLSRTGTVAKASIRLDTPRVEVFVVAREKRRVVAQAGSEAEPLVVSPVSTAPALADAWSETPPPPAAPPPPLPGPVDTATAAAPPPPLTPPPPPAGGDTSELGTMEITLLAVGGAVVVASVVTAVLLLATRTPRCDVQEGQGCVEVQVVPSSLVRF
jgi:hypothetical protein